VLIKYSLAGIKKCTCAAFAHHT